MLTIGILWRGSFGQFINTLIDQYAPNTIRKVYDPHASSSHDVSLRDACECDLVFVAVPIRVFEQTIEQCKDLFSRETIVVDVCTVKAHPLHCLQKIIPNQPYLSTHPMFGPYSYTKKWNLQDLRLVVCDHTLSPDRYEQIMSISRLLQLSVIQCSADEHDQMLAKSLFLTHYITQIVVESWLENTEIDTVSFGNLMDVVASVRDDTRLFQDVWKYNPYCKEVVEQLETAKQKVDTLLWV